MRPEDERELEPALKWTSLDFTVPLDNPVFMAYRFMGILNSRAVPAQSATGMGVRSELGIIMLDDAALVLIPGEIFPELVSGEAYARANPDGVNPRPLKEIAAGYGLFYQSHGALDEHLLLTEAEIQTAESPGAQMLF